MEWLIQSFFKLIGATRIQLGFHEFLAENFQNINLEIYLEHSWNITD